MQAESPVLLGLISMPLTLGAPGSVWQLAGILMQVIV